MKALIPAARKTNERFFVKDINKHLFPLANKPMIFHAIEKVAAAGLNDIGIIVPEGEPELPEIVGDGSRWGITITYIPQRGGTRGIVHAMMAAREFLGTEPFVVYLADNLVSDDLSKLLERFSTQNLSCLLALARIQDPHRFGVPVFDGERIVRVEERPFHPQSPYAVAGIYLYGPEAHDLAQLLRPSARGDYEISELHTKFIERGYPLEWEEIFGWWKDTGKPEDLVEGNHMALKSLVTDVSGYHEPGVVLSGPCSIGKGSKILGRSVIHGPAIIGDGCLINDAYIGPFTSIGDRVELHGAEIENSIVLPDARIATAKRIQGSIIGEGAVISAEPETKPSGHRIFIGPGSLIEL